MGWVLLNHQRTDSPPLRRPITSTPIHKQSIFENACASQAEPRSARFECCWSGPWTRQPAEKLRWHSQQNLRAEQGDGYFLGAQQSLQQQEQQQSLQQQQQQRQQQVQQQSLRLQHSAKNPLYYGNSRSWSRYCEFALFVVNGETHLLTVKTATATSIDTKPQQWHLGSKRCLERSS